jgi:hypothetical protein
MPPTALIEEHAHLADGLLPFVIALAVGALGMYYWQYRTRPGHSSTALVPRWLVAVIMVVALAGAVGTTVQVVRIGHSGAKAAWSSVG